MAMLGNQMKMMRYPSLISRFLFALSYPVVIVALKILCVFI
jgi:hypothetical protein